MQISFLPPPFGPAAFYLKSVTSPDISLGDTFRSQVLHRPAASGLGAPDRLPRDRHMVAGLRVYHLSFWWALKPSRSDNEAISVIPQQGRLGSILSKVMPSQPTLCSQTQRKRTDSDVRLPPVLLKRFSAAHRPTREERKIDAQYRRKQRWRASQKGIPPASKSWCNPSMQWRHCTTGS
jgi:hypothetical protein